MVTTPPEHTSAPMESHQAREAAESFGVDAARYDRARSSYPDALIETLVAASPGRRFLDVGMGTGIVGRQLQAAGCTVLGVEPDARMAEFARSTGCEVEVATFEEWDPAGREFDTVVSGQSWHWVDPVAGPAKAAEVLRPGGLLSMFWNVSKPPVELERAFGEVYRRVLPDSPMVTAAQSSSGGDPYKALSDKSADALVKSGAFGQLDRQKLTWEKSYTRAEWLEVSATTGITSRLPKEIMERVFEGLGEAIDAVGGSFTCECGTVVITATRTDA
jgi:SAM-dependent methyltransferase